MVRFLRSALLVVGVAAVLGVLAFGPQLVSHFFTTKKAVDPALATVARSSFPVIATASGIVLPQSEMDVNFAVAGQIREIDVQLGTKVSRGQVLAKLDDTNQQAALQGALVAVSYAQVALGQAEAGTSKQSITTAQLQLANANLQLQRARGDEARTVLTAPETATVLQINNQIGENVSAGGTHAGAGVQLPGTGTGQNPFLVLGNGTSFVVEASFSQGDAAQIKGGLSGTVVFDAIPGLGLPVHVASIASVANQVNGVPQFDASVTLDQNDPRLRTGMTATVNVTVAQASNVLAVPNQAVYTFQNGPHVDVWFRGGAVPTAVTLGLTGDQLTEVTSGLSAGQQVLLPGPQGLPTPAAHPGSAASPSP
jgi:macrolide-specific efflux system membrane fusion protein